MGFLVLLVVLGLPVVEIWLMIEIGRDIGALPTVALILATAGLGMLLFRVQGMATLARVQAHLDRGEAPVGELLSGLGLLVAGLMLLIPGFLTDAIGLVLFIPPVRRLLIGTGLAWALARGETRIWTSRTRGGGHGGGRGDGRSGSGPIIDGDFQDVTGAPDTPGRPDTQVGPDPRRIDRDDRRS
ncbi:membrane protein [Thalassobaculum fulvum]|uniref:Membrane protein n=1 Tax=Thalassobaculum fulvum TaxID=1633335 RepID=A0A918XML5_9PROT|nr:FxsA family protein [Thalassobaculum fulvum]GHD39708.1 membrane protein [Thalassobaculum fulvum]